MVGLHSDCTVARVQKASREKFGDNIKDCMVEIDSCGPFSSPEIDG